MNSLRLSGCAILDPQPGGRDFRSADMVDGLVIDDGLVARQTRAGTPLRGGCAEIDLSGDYLLPGLINAHDHLHLNSASGFRPEMRFRNSGEWIEWLSERVGLGDEGRKSPSGLNEPLEVRLWHGALKNVLCGATTVAHHDPWHEILEDPDLPVRLVECGWAHSPELAGEYGPTLEESWKATPDHQPWVIHLAEGVDQQAGAELEALVRAGCLDSRTVAVHAVGLDDERRRLFLRHGASVIWCPSSNLAMLGTTLDPRLWNDAGEGGGSRLAIGTDSRLTGVRDLLEELRVAAESSGLGAVELVRLVTTDAARILRLDVAGRLSAGAPADLIVLRGGEDPWRTLLEAERADLRGVAIAGRPVVADPDLEPWFSALGIEPIRAELDGRPKLVDPSALGPSGAAELEPGFEVIR